MVINRVSKSWDDPPSTNLPPVHHPPGQIEHDLDSSQNGSLRAPNCWITFLGVGGKSKTATITHTIHVWHIYLHWVNLYGKCREIYHTWILWVIGEVSRRHTFFQWYEQFFWKVEVWSRTSKWLAEERWTMRNEGKGRCSTTRWSPTS